MTQYLCGGTIFEQTRLDQISQLLKARNDHDSLAAQESSDHQVKFLAGTLIIMQLKFPLNKI